MILELFEEREKMKAKKEYKENIGRISDNEEICNTIDELVERLEESDLDFKDKFIEDLKDWKYYVKAEIEHYEDEDIEIMEFLEGK